MRLGAPLGGFALPDEQDGQYRLLQNGEWVVYTPSAGGGGSGDSLAQIAVSPSGSINVQANNHYLLNLSGLNTAASWATMPSAQVGDKVRLTVTATSANYELKVSLGAGLWSKIWQVGESVEFECIGGQNWVITHDGRKACHCKITMQGGSNVDATHNSWVDIPLTTVDSDTAGLADVVNNGIRFRRSNQYAISAQLLVNGGRSGSMYLRTVDQNGNLQIAATLEYFEWAWGGNSFMRNHKVNSDVVTSMHMRAKHTFGQDTQFSAAINSFLEIKEILL